MRLYGEQLYWEDYREGNAGDHAPNHPSRKPGRVAVWLASDGSNRAVRRAGSWTAASRHVPQSPGQNCRATRHFNVSMVRAADWNGARNASNPYSRSSGQPRGCWPDTMLCRPGCRSCG